MNKVAIRNHLRRGAQQRITGSVIEFAPLDGLDDNQVMEWLMANPDHLEDPRLWPQLVHRYTALRRIVDLSSRACPATRALAWFVAALGPDLPFKLCVRERCWASRELNSRGSALACMFRDDVWRLGLDAELMERAGYTAKETLSIGECMPVALRLTVAVRGAEVILTKPELTGKALNREIYKEVTDDLDARVLTLEARNRARGEDRQACRIRVKMTECLILAFGKWNQEKQIWERTTEAKPYLLVTLNESDLTPTSASDGDRNDEVLARIKTGDWRPGEVIEINGRPLWNTRDGAAAQAQWVAREILGELWPLLTERQQAVILAKAEGRNLNAAERRALCDARCKVRNYLAEHDGKVAGVDMNRRAEIARRSTSQYRSICAGHSRGDGSRHPRTTGRRSDISGWYWSMSNHRPDSQPGFARSAVPRRVRRRRSATLDDRGLARLAGRCSFGVSGRGAVRPNELCARTRSSFRRKCAQPHNSSSYEKRDCL